ncbi:riboflavin biosynthesis protein RibF, partial [bacterium]|nr:riboflavin biosynthesis protein RibF [bacterium]
MDIIRDLERLRPEPESVLSIGSFDGVHLAHQEILHRLCLIGKERGLRKTVVTFSPHPQVVVHSRGEALQLLTDDEEKTALLAAAGIERLVILPFDRKMAALEGERFLREILLERIGFREMIIGHNHGFGKGRSGNRDTLVDLSERYNFRLEVVPPIQLDEVRISS